MTPQQFIAAYKPTAETVHEATGLYVDVLLAQWALETAWSTSWAGMPCNLANIRDSTGAFAQFSSLSDFAGACIWTFENARPNLNLPVSASNNYYWGVLATKSSGPAVQMTALGASAWDGPDHYDSGAGPGSALIPYHQEICMGTVADLDQSWLADVNARQASFLGITSGDVAPVTVAELLAAIKAIQAPPPASVDLQPVLDAIAAVKAEVDAIKAKTDKDLA